MRTWTLRRAPLGPDEVVAPDERLPWLATTGIGLQHVLAMFGATVTVPILTGLPPSTTILFSGLGTLVFFLMTRGRVPSYTGSSFAFIAPILAAKSDGNVAEAFGGIFAAGLTLFAIGVLVDRLGFRILSWMLPPVVTGTVVALLGLNLAPVAKDQFSQQAGIALFTLVVILLIAVGATGFIRRMAIFVGVAAGYGFAAILGEVDLSSVGSAAWVGLPDFTAPAFSWNAILLTIPTVIFALVAENAGHVRAVAAMTGSPESLDDQMGRSFMGDGAATMLAGLGGGSGTTTYAENIGVMAVTRIYSTAAYVVAGLAAIALGLLPKFGALISAIPIGVIGGAITVLFGMIAVLSGRIWIEGRVDFTDPVNLLTAAVGLIVGAGNYTLNWGDYSFTGISLGAFGTVLTYQVLRLVRRRTGAVGDGSVQLAVADAPVGAPLGAATTRGG